jgi:hypothetical protein
MKWKTNMRQKLEEMAYQNELMLARTQQISHHLPPEFCEALRQLCEEVARLQKSLS